MSTPRDCSLGTPLSTVSVHTVDVTVSFDGSGFDATRATNASWLKVVGGGEYQYYAGVPFANTQELGLASSFDDGQTWTKITTGDPLILRSTATYWATQRLVPVRAFHEDNKYKLWYWGNSTNLLTDTNNIQGFGYGTSVDGQSWTLEPDPIRVESGPKEGARLLEVIKLGTHYLAYYDDLNETLPRKTYLAMSANGSDFSEPDQHIQFGDDYELTAAATKPGDTGCFLGIWKKRSDGSYIATTSDNGTDFTVVSTITFPNGFRPEDISIDGQDVPSTDLFIRGILIGTMETTASLLLKCVFSNRIDLCNLLGFHASLKFNDLPHSRLPVNPIWTD